jgi:hypothetical protein
MRIVAPARDRLISFIDASAEHLGEIAIVAALAVAKAWSRYADRRDTKRAGRRASDRDRAAYAKSITRLEQLVAELTTLIARLTARVRALERAAGRKED